MTSKPIDPTLSAKSIRHYIPGFKYNWIILGQRATVYYYNEGDPANLGIAHTTTVTRVEPDGEFETLNTIYKPDPEHEDN